MSIRCTIAMLPAAATAFKDGDVVGFKNTPTMEFATDGCWVETGWHPSTSDEGFL